MTLTSDEITKIREVISNADKTLEETDSGSHYQNTYTYFYVPKDFGSSATTTDDTGLGAVLRLGGYSDLEEPENANLGKSQGSLHAVQSEVYPAQHISDETSDKAHQNAPGKQTSGENNDIVKRQGSLMACDGRVLLRSGEKIYVHAAEQIHVQSDENIALVTVNGSIDSTSGENFTVKATKKVSMRSGVGNPDNYTARGVNTSGTKGIEIIADEGNSDVYIEGLGLFLQVNGTSTADITANNSTVMRADNFEDIWGHNTSIFRGTFFELYFGAGLSYRAAASLNVATALDVNIGLFDVGITGIEITKTVLEVKSSMFKSKNVAVEAETTATRARSDAVCVGSTATKAESEVVTASIGNVKSLIAFWEAKIASTAQI